MAARACVWWQDEGLSVTKRQGSHVMAEMAAQAEGHWEWRTIDMQVGREVCTVL